MMQRWARWVAALALVAAGSEALPEDGEHVSLVPWKVLNGGDPPDAPLVLYWVPATPDELRRSDLVTSGALTAFSSQCVAMRVIRADDRPMLGKLNIESELPVAVLADGDGRIITRVLGEEGALDVFEVEDMVREELDRRAAEAEETLDHAREKADGGDVVAAVALYQSVWEQRCVCPRQGRDAQRAMRKLRSR
jgi:hypothetical protein